MNASAAAEGKSGKLKPKSQSEPVESSGSMDLAAMHGELQEASSMEGDELSIRAEFRRITMQYASGMGVGHVVQGSDGEWDLKPSHVTGRVPRRHDFVERFGKCCSAAIQRKKVQIEHFLGLEALYVPIHGTEDSAEVLLVLTEEKNAAKAIFIVETISSYLSLWRKSGTSTSNSWKLNSLAALVELVSGVESVATVDEACQLAANELARQLGLKHIGVGCVSRRQFKPLALSGSAQLNTNSETSRSLAAVMNEATLRSDVAIWPPAKEADDFLLLAHQQLANLLGEECVSSVPLTTVDDEVVGALVLAGKSEELSDSKVSRLMRTLSPRLASALRVVRRAQGGPTTRLLRAVSKRCRGSKKMVYAAVLACFIGVLCLPMPYRVRCRCTAEATERRFAVAPFQGIVERGYVEPGDEVRKGDLLATMDSQAIRLELANTLAKRNQARKEHEVALSERRISDAVVAQLQVDEFNAKIELLRHQEGQVEIRSPVDGVVISGSLERAENAAVDLGDTLFEVGPLAPMRIEAAVPSDEITQIRVGQTVRIWMEGLGSQSFTAAVEHIEPRSEVRDSENIFLVDCRVPNSDLRLRPGMKGRVRIDGPNHPLAWNLFHKPWQNVLSRITWW